MALTAIFFPKLTELLATGKKENLASIYKTVTKWVLLFNLFLMPLFLLFPELALHLMTTVKPDNVHIHMIRIFGLFCIYSTHSTYLIYTNKYDIQNSKFILHLLTFHTPM